VAILILRLSTACLHNNRRIRAGLSEPPQSRPVKQYGDDLQRGIGAKFLGEEVGEKLVSVSLVL
jgi:hypothetical protein